MDIVDRIQHLVDENNLTIAALERELGLSNGIIKKWKKQNPSCDKIMLIANYLRVSTDFILKGVESNNQLSTEENELLRIYNSLPSDDKIKVKERAETLAELAAERAAQEAQQHKAATEQLTQVYDPAADGEPVLEQKTFYIDICALPASAGTGVYLDDSSTEPLEIVHTPIAERANYAVRVSGVSMLPDFSDGDIVLIETCPSVEIGEIGIFIVNGEGFIKKRGKDRLISLNPESEDVLIHQGDTVCCRGRVLGKAEMIN